MDTRYPISRIIATLPGIFCGLILLETLCHFVQGPGPGLRSCVVIRTMSGFSWRDSNPLLSFLMGVLWSGAAFGGSLLMWARPRLGYFCAGMGYQLYLTQLFVEWISNPWVDRGLNSSGWMLRLFALPAWLFWLCVHDEPPRRLLLASGSGSARTG